MHQEYRLIWFQHLQKAAGSTIIQMAIQNDETFFSVHENGNPCYPDGREIRLWEFNSQELAGFIDQCQDNGVTFVATEKAAPIFSVLSSDPRVCLITCLRDPLERFISHFYYSLYTGRTNVSSPEQFVDSIYISTMFNYYCRIFSRFNDNPGPVGKKQFDIARAILSSFDCCVVLENKNPFTKLNKLLSWKDMEIHANPTKPDFVTIVKFLIKGKINLVLRRFTDPRKGPTNDFQKLFKERNKWDYSLYQIFNKTA